MTIVIFQMILRYVAPTMLVLFVSCSKTSVFSTGEIEKKPESLLGAVDLQIDESAPVYEAKFKVSVDSERMNLCKGNATLTIYTDMSTKPTGVLDCGVFPDKDLSSMFDDGLEKEKLNPSLYSEAGLIQRLPNPKENSYGSYFHPPMPFILGPIVQDPEVFKDYRFSETTKLRVVGPAGVTETIGSFTLEVINHSLSYVSEQTGERFNDVIYWESRATGFNGVKKAKHRIFDKWTWWWRPRPISIVKMEMKTTLGQLMDASEAGSFGNLFGVGEALMGEITISWDLVEEVRY